VRESERVSERESGPQIAVRAPAERRVRVDVSIRQHMSAYVSNVSIRQHTSAYVSIRCSKQRAREAAACPSAYVSIRHHSTAYVAGSKGSERGSSMRTQTCMSEGAKGASEASAYVSIRQHTSAFEQHAYANMHVKGGACGASIEPCYEHAHRSAVWYAASRARERASERERKRSSASKRAREGSRISLRKDALKKKKERLRRVEDEYVCAKPERLVVCGK
jgi:hypothetical protein